MKRLIAVVLAGCICALLSCSKMSQANSEYPYVYLHDCVNKSFSNKEVQLCFTELVTDSRCPSDVVCFWSGVATGKFRFITRNREHTLTLSTTSSISDYRQDTVVDGYTIKLINIHPYPKSPYSRVPDSEIKAEVMITKN